MSRGRGRGRGRGRSFGNIEALKVHIPGEPLPPPILHPPPLFPQLERKPLELRATQETEYLLGVKQGLRQHMKQSPFYLKAGLDKKDIQRYSDKYKVIEGSELDNVLEWSPDWKFFPKELQIRVKRRKRRLSGSQFKPNVPAKRAKRENERTTEIKNPSGVETTEELHETTDKDVSKRTKKVSFSLEDPTQFTERFEQLEKKEQVENDSGEEGLDDEEEELYDEDLEEETDYNLTYFDNGEEYGVDDDDNLEEGPYY